MRRHCLVLVQPRLQLGFLLLWDAGFIWSFLGTLRSIGIAEPESKRNPEIIHLIFFYKPGVFIHYT